MHLIHLVLLSRVCESVQGAMIQDVSDIYRLWRAFEENTYFFILYSRSPKEQIISHEYTKHLPSSTEMKTHKPERRLPLNPD